MIGENSFQPEDDVRTGHLVALVLGCESPIQVVGYADIQILTTANSTEALHYLESGNVAVLLLGPLLMPLQALEILSYLDSQPSFICPLIIVLCSGLSRSSLQHYVDNGCIFYLASGMSGERDISSLVLSALNHVQRKIKKDLDLTGDKVRELLDFCTRLPMQLDVVSAGELLAATVGKLIRAPHVRCLVHDETADTIAPTKALRLEEPDLHSAASGIAAFIVRSGKRVRLTRVGTDPRYDFETDNPDGGQNDRLLAAPILGYGDVRLAAVLATRSGEDLEFSEDQERLLELICECAAPTFNQLLLQDGLQNTLSRLTTTEVLHSPIFREEALEEHIQGSYCEGRVVKSLPRWLSKTYWTIVALVSLTALGTVIGRTTVVATGPAVVHLEDTTIQLSAPDSGRVRSVEVSQGTPIKVGDILALIDVLPQDNASTGHLQQIRAEVSGTISDIRIQNGQIVNTGDKLATILPEQAHYEMLAFLPELYSSQLRPGMAVRVSISGLNSETLRVDSVGKTALSPIDALRFAGIDAGDFRLSGPVVVVQAWLPPALGHAADYNRIAGGAQVTIRSEPIIVSLIPGLRQILERLK